MVSYRTQSVTGTTVPKLTHVYTALYYLQSLSQPWAQSGCQSPVADLEDASIEDVGKKEPSYTVGGNVD
jgi:hypothetical protein